MFHSNYDGFCGVLRTSFSLIPPPRCRHFRATSLTQSCRRKISLDQVERGETEKSLSLLLSAQRKGKFHYEVPEGERKLCENCLFHGLISYEAHIFESKLPSSSSPCEFSMSSGLSANTNEKWEALKNFLLAGKAAI